MELNEVEVTDLHNTNEDAEMDAIAAAEGAYHGIYDDEDYSVEKKAEVDSLIKMGTFVARDRQQALQDGHQIFQSRWVLTNNGKRKARLVAKQFAGKHSCHDSEYYAATPTTTAFRLSLVWCSHHKVA